MQNRRAGRLHGQKLPGRLLGCHVRALFERSRVGLWAIVSQGGNRVPLRFILGNAFVFPNSGQAWRCAIGSSISRRSWARERTQDQGSDLARIVAGPSQRLRARAG